MALELADSRPCRCFLFCPRSRLRFLEASSPEVRSSFTACARELRPRPEGPGQLSWDSLSLQRVQTSRVHVLPFDGKAPLPRPGGLARSLPTGPMLPATVPLTGFLNLSATCSSRCRPAIFRQVALMGLRPPGIFSSHEASGDSSLPEYPPDVLPAGCAAPVPGWSAFGHTARS
jgi:hypothetical protein